MCDHRRGRLIYVHCATVGTLVSFIFYFLFYLFGWPRAYYVCTLEGQGAKIGVEMLTRRFKFSSEGRRLTHTPRCLLAACRSIC
ncbi:hypothetical protein LZ32DRAFT_100296 [Colletotrichum eremochloae]|nr:hypothetical protein LZ32DRAFT_100296 [Colletotrichum eremochloae]